MRLSLTLLFFLVLGLINPTSTSWVSGPPEDFEGSGYDLDSSGSGSGEGSVPAGKSGPSVEPNGGSGSRNIFPDSSGGTSDNAHFPGGMSDSELLLLGKQKSVLDNKEVLGAVIAGGVIGGLLAAAATAIIIYRWLKKDGEEQSLGLWKTSDEGYQKTSREEYIV